jgi:hypothetical protein
MKMIWHQTPSQNISIRQNVFSDLLQKVKVIFLPEKYLLTVVALIVYVINVSFFEKHVSLI